MPRKSQSITTPVAQHRKPLPKDQTFAREAFTSEANIVSLINQVIAKESEDVDWDESYRDFLSNIYSQNAKNIFRLCESPIEQMLWGGALVRSAFQCQWLEFWSPPEGDFIEASKQRVGSIDSIGTSKISYELHPDRKLISFEQFVAWTQPQFSTDEVKQWVDAAMIQFDLNFMFVPTVVLQPSLKIGGKLIRPDAIAFIPAFPNKKIVVECDGFEFHGSQDRFTADRSRDRLISAEHGMEVRRYSGQEIYNTPMQIAEDIVCFLRSKLGTPEHLGRKWKSAKRAWVKKKMATPATEIAVKEGMAP